MARHRGKDESNPPAKPSVKGESSPSQTKGTQSQGGCCSCCCRCIKYLFYGIVIVIGLFAAVLYYLPSPVDPVAYKFSESSVGPPPFTGIFTLNNELQKSKRLFEGELVGPEAFAADKDGYLYTGLVGGQVVKINPRTETYEVLTRMGDPPYNDCEKVERWPACGRPLGLQIDRHGNLLLVDSYKGLFRINTETGEKQRLFKSEESGDLSCLFFNNLAVHSNGSIFISCSSTKFPLHDYVFDTTEGRSHGKVFHYNPTSGHTALVKKDLYSANGIALSSGEDFLILSEVSRARILKYHLKGPSVGKWELFADNLPALVDNITPTKSSPGFWAAGVIVREGTILDFTADKPWIRLIAAKLRVLKLLEHYATKHTMVMMIDEKGTVTKCLQDQTGKTVYRVSEAFEFEGSIYLGSYIAPFLGKLKL